MSGIIDKYLSVTQSSFPMFHKHWLKKLQSVIECCDCYGQGYPSFLKMEPGAQAGSCQASEGF